MAKVTPISEHFQHFLADLKETFWGDVYGQTRLAWQRFFQLESERQRDRFAGWGWYERGARKRRQYRNGYYERDFVTRFGTLRLRIARTRGKSFLPCGLQRFQRCAEEVSMLIREAFLRGISTRQVGRVVAVLSGEGVSAQTVSKLTRDLDQAVWEFHQARLSDDYAYLFLDGVSLRIRRSAGRKRVQMLVAYGVRRDGTRHLLAFLRSQGESQADWEALLQDPVPAWAGGQAAGLDRHRRLSRFGGGDSDRLSTGASSALLGAQNAQYFREGAQVRPRRSEEWRSGYLFGGEPGPGRSRLPRFPGALAAAVRGHGAPAGTRSAGTALLFCFSPTLVAQITHYECDRALLRGGATSHPADGLLCERRERGPHHLLHLPAIQSGMENPHPLRIYTGSLTSPPPTEKLKAGCPVDTILADGRRPVPPPLR